MRLFRVSQIVCGLNVGFSSDLFTTKIHGSGLMEEGSLLKFFDIRGTGGLLEGK